MNRLRSGLVVLAAVGLLPASPLPSARADDAPAPLLPPDAVWVMRYDDKLDGEVTGRPEDAVRWALAVRNDRVTGGLAGHKPADPADHHVAGEAAPGTPPLVLLRQDGPKGLVCYYAGRRVEAGRVVGTWYDNRGKAGDFEMVVEKK